MLYHCLFLEQCIHLLEQFNGNGDATQRVNEFSNHVQTVTSCCVHSVRATKQQRAIIRTETEIASVEKSQKNDLHKFDYL